MITTDMIGEVLRMHRRDKKSARQDVKAARLARDMARKYLSTYTVEKLQRCLREDTPIKLQPFVESIKHALLVDARQTSGSGLKPKRQGSQLFLQFPEMLAAA